MRNSFFIQKGLIFSQKNTTDNDTKGLFSLDVWFKRMLTRYNLGYIDTCCTADRTNLPIRYNKTAAKLQYFDDITKTWTNLTTF